MLETHPARSKILGAQTRSLARTSQHYCQVSRNFFVYFYGGVNKIIFLVWTALMLEALKICTVLLQSINRPKSLFMWHLQSFYGKSVFFWRKIQKDDGVKIDRYPFYEKNTFKKGFSVKNLHVVLISILLITFCFISSRYDKNWCQAKILLKFVL